jgi:hypothetical protein
MLLEASFSADISNLTEEMIWAPQICLEYTSTVCGVVGWSQLPQNRLQRLVEMDTIF